MIRLTLNIDMPKNCIECPFNYDCLFCIAATEGERDLLYEDEYYIRREEWCPLEEVKQE